VPQPCSEPVIRPARPEEKSLLEALITRSARELSQNDYSHSEIEALIENVFGVDSELLGDGTYLVAMIGDDIAGCGGWSRRRTLFGGDRFSERANGYLDPSCDAAKIRAFFVDPRHARRGVGTTVLAACERAAIAAGFQSFELMATLPGRPFYSAHGYVEGAPAVIDADGERLHFIQMSKRCGAQMP
jgi:GNAT superfamily N-acetyltransferase